MIGRAFLFLILGSSEGAALGAASVHALVAAPTENVLMPVGEAAVYWAVIGAIHGVVLFFASLGVTPTIESTRRGRLVLSNFAKGFDYRRFGHRIPYVTVFFGLVVAFGIAPLLAQRPDIDLTSVGLRLVAGIGLCFAWTVIAMLANTVIVSKVALRGKS